MKKILTKIVIIFLALLLVDLFILFTALAQIALENRTGYWNPFWRWQAEQVVRFLQIMK
ncbi:MAG: hypothetical protein KatS3mg101_1094 [Patescibacteria group bacterium]|nr:MAG: hypothetical protein KatS3mg101_1094 [Patescibacteria group bacterium]